MIRQPNVRDVLPPAQQPGQLPKPAPAQEIPRVALMGTTYGDTSERCMETLVNLSKRPYRYGAPYASPHRDRHPSGGSFAHHLGRRRSGWKGPGNS
eukprot:2965287-Amphidinium_carterae.1